MPNFGTTEIIIIGFLTILFFGKDKLPEFARSMGDSFKIFKDSVSDKNEIEEEIKESLTIPAAAKKVKIVTTKMKKTVKKTAKK